MNHHDNAENYDDDENGRSLELRKSLQMAVMGICEKEEEDNSSSTLSANALKALAELTFCYATTSLAQDLELFSSHAKRQTITADDVKLVVRKNPDIHEKLTIFCQEQQDARDIGSLAKKGGGAPKKQKKSDVLDNDMTNNDSSSSSSSSEEEEFNADMDSPFISKANERPSTNNAAHQSAIQKRDSFSSHNTENLLPAAAAAAPSKKTMAQRQETIEIDLSSSNSSSSSSSTEGIEFSVQNKAVDTKGTLNYLEDNNIMNDLSDSDDEF